MTDSTAEQRNCCHHAPSLGRSPASPESTCPQNQEWAAVEKGQYKRLCLIFPVLISVCFKCLKFPNHPLWWWKRQNEWVWEALCHQFKSPLHPAKKKSRCWQYHLLSVIFNNDMLQTLPNPVAYNNKHSFCLGVCMLLIQAEFSWAVLALSWAYSRVQG